MGRPILSDEAYSLVRSAAKKAGSATHVGEQRHREGKGLHELVDPKGYGVIRRSLSWLEPDGDHFVLLRGVAILEETRLDTTGSMGDNVERAMRVLPKTYDLLAKGEKAVLGRYDTQMITSIFGDQQDHYILCRSQAEMDERIAEQMTLMLPEADGGDSTEDPQYGLFAGAYLTQASIKMMGLKSYDFTITDANARDHVTMANLKRVFGDEVMDKVRENGFEIDENQLPTTKQIVAKLLEHAHAFLLFVGSEGHTRRYWENIYGKERVITLPSVNFLPEVKAAIIGLTEGTLDLQNLQKYLTHDAKLSKDVASEIVKAVTNIPIGAQMLLPNFEKIPRRGATYAKKGDLWPAKKLNKNKVKESKWL